MDIKDIEAQIVLLKGKQSDYFKKKKADRNVSEIEAVRKELGELKSQAKAIYRPAKTVK
jgi:hypothetical protein